MRRRQLSIDNAAAPRLRAASGICRSTGQTDGRTDTRPLHRFCTAYYAGIVNNRNLYTSSLANCTVNTRMLKKKVEYVNGPVGALTFLGRLTEDGVAFADGHESDVVVVDDVLRVLEAVVSAYEVTDGGCDRPVVHEMNVENLRRSFIVVRQASLA